MISMRRGFPFSLWFLNKAVLSSGANDKSTTYALRSRAYVTEDDSNRLEWTNVGHILGAVKGCPTPICILLLIGISTPYSGGIFSPLTAPPTG